MIKLKPFGKTDFYLLINWIPDEKFLMQWGGIKLSFPLDHKQLNNLFLKTNKNPPLIYLFKATETADNKTIGHSQILRIDYKEKICTIGRIIVGQPGKYYGLNLVALTLDHAFYKLKMNEVNLKVFAFNLVALGLYKKLGFEQFDYLENDVRWSDDETWDLVRMKINKKKWGKIKKLDKINKLLQLP
ncbi:MAG: GNAT family protein [Pseudomonadota bacterium]